MCILDRDLRYREINPWLAAMNGLPVDEHIGQHLREVIPDVSAEIEETLRWVLATGGAIRGGVIQAPTPAFPDELRTFQHDLEPVRCGAGLIVGVRCIVQDVTRRVG